LRTHTGRWSRVGVGAGQFGAGISRPTAPTACRPEAVPGLLPGSSASTGELVCLSRHPPRETLCAIFL